MSSRRSNALYTVALLAQVVLFHRHVLFLPDYVFPWDFRNFHLPLTAFAASSFAQGHWPLWDPFTYCGNPIFANIQAALFYPPALAAALAGAWLGTQHIPFLLALVELGEIWLAGIGAYLLLRRLGARPAAAWIAGTVYELGCFFASQAQHMGAIGAAAWLPFAWLAVLQGPAGLPLLAISLAMSVLAGFPAAAGAAFGSALLLAALIALFRLGPKALPFRALAGWMWALALATIQIAPAVQLTFHSVAKYRAEWLKAGGGIKLAALITLISPNYWNVFDFSKFHGPGNLTFLYLYSSLLGLALALAAMCWKPDRWCRVFTALTLCGVLWMLGDSTPLGRTVFEALPVRIRIGIHPEFALEVFALGIAVLAGLGAHRFLRNPRLELLVGLAIALDLTAVGSGRPFNVVSTASEPGFTADSIDSSREFAGRLRALTGAAVPPHRFDTADASYNFGNAAALLQIPTANGCDPMAPERVIQVRLSFAPGARWGACYQVVNPSSPVVGLIDARYLISRTPIPDPAYRPVADFVGYKVFENPRALPRFFFATRVQLARDLAESAALLHAPDFDPSVAIIEAAGLPLEPVSGASGQIAVLSYSANHLALRTRSDTPALLVATDTHYPGWQATLDGAPTPIHIADVAFRGIAVPPGEHRVEMRFVPAILYWSAAVSALAALALVFSAFSRRLRLFGEWPVRTAETQSRRENAEFK